MEEDKGLQNGTLQNGTQLSHVNGKRPLTEKDIENNEVHEKSQDNQSDNWCSKKFSLFRYPKGVFFCLGNEFSERFSYYGMTAILTLYLVNVHHLPHHTAKLIFHAFHFVAYFTPILGSILADGFLGKFRVILYVSIAYCIGHLFITLGSLQGISVEAGRGLDYTGLLIIAIATGGIKPCVVSFAADQFPPTQLAERKQFFSFFYFCINAGAFISTFVTPVFRSKVSCYGQEGCYPLAFGVPAIFMGLALIIFICGKPFYKIVNCEENIIWSVCKCITTGIVKTVKNRGPPEKGGHWLDHCIPIYGRRLVTDIKGIFSIMLLYVPVIFFWALFDQQGSTWVLQADRMDGRFGQMTIIPEQMNVLNPLLIITLIPLFEEFLYPVLTKRGFLVTPLRRMGWGGVLAAVSFFIAGFIQLKINDTMVVMPNDGEVKYQFVNLADCNVNFFNEQFNVTPHISVLKNMKAPHEGNSLPEFEFENCYQPFINETSIDSSKGQFVVFWNNNVSQTSYTLEKTGDGQSRVYPMFHPSFSSDHHYKVSIIASQEGKELRHTLDTNDKSFNLEPPFYGSNVFDLSLEVCTNNVSCNITHLNYITVKAGEANGLIILENGTAILINLIPPNTVHILWQVPQYVIITVAEMLFSISGLEFSYSQAAPTMKSVLQAIWLMTVAFGNVFDMIISGSSMIENPAVEFFVYASIMLGIITVFAFLAYRYKYVNQDIDETEIQKLNE